jgi:predicted nucleic acid-binding Zn ribbon protein
LQRSFPCPKCGTQIPIGQKFCSTCGEQFDYRCGHCGAAIKTPSGFCTSCGKTLHQQTKPPTDFSAKRAIETSQKEKARQKTAMPPQPISQVGRYLILLVVIILIVAILYAVSMGPQGESSNWFGGNFIFGGQSPPSTPPDTEIQPTPEPAIDSPRYTADQVIAVAKKLSPDCRLPTRRTG